MCGITGIVAFNTVERKEILSKQNDQMIHRGPDDSGLWWSDDGCVGLAHRRLAIIDLSPRGHQPMMNDCGDLCIVFNGEIYNFIELRKELILKSHVFQSDSDTEVILAAYKEWGVDCLTHLNGMFAFALYDLRSKKIFIARDRAGEKPLFYSMTNGVFIFASELKALLVNPEISHRINPIALDCYLSMGFVPKELCIVDGVKKLPAAHALLYDLSTKNINIWQYWNLPELSANESKTINEPSLLDELESLVEDAVKRQLIADVPVGVLLSGGVDSSLITAMAVRATSKVKTFTIRFPGFGIFDETEHARLIARHFGTEHVELDAVDTTVDILPLLAKQFDEPMLDSSMIPTYLVCQLIRKYCTVALGGDGGDELFGGYQHYSRLLWMEKNFKKIPFFVRQSIANTAGAILPVGFKGRNWLQGLNIDFNSGLPLIASYFDLQQRKKLIKNKSNWQFIAEQIRASSIPNTAGLLNRATRMDFNNYLAEDILVKVDRASMLNSLEIRAPFLDYRLVEFAFGKVHSTLKATDTERKHILKKLAARLLPPEFDMHRKQGFSIPLASWLSKDSWYNYFSDVLLGEDDQIFSKKYLQELLKAQRNGCSNSERLFSLVLFKLWKKEYKITL
jgi:asparagine synthase (glutamine-hydrolysing)